MIRGWLIGVGCLLFLMPQAESRIIGVPVIGIVLQAGEEGPGTMEAEILKLVNQHRRKKGLGPMSWNQAMSDVAHQHSSNMARKKTAFGHNGFEQRVKKISAKTGGLKGWAENVAHGQISASEVMKGWLKSPGHRKNIEGKYNLIGIGIESSRNGDLYFTQIFGLK